jgi:hemolysin III
MTSTSTAAQKPRLRGWSHLVAFVVALVAGSVLVAGAPSLRNSLIALVYVLSLATLYGVSALYHVPTWQPRARALLKRVDHSAIFLLIAGTYTPFCLLGLDEEQGVLLLTIVWGGALAGIGQKVLWPRTPRWVSALPYVVLGWVGFASLPYAQPHMADAGVVLLVAGGVAYTVGAIAYAMKRPNPVPGVFGYHEVFHAFVIVASALHFVAIAQLVWR